MYAKSKVQKYICIQIKHYIFIKLRKIICYIEKTDNIGLLLIKSYLSTSVGYNCWYDMLHTDTGCHKDLTVYTSGCPRVPQLDHSHLLSPSAADTQVKVIQVQRGTSKSTFLSEKLVTPVTARKRVHFYLLDKPSHFPLSYPTLSGLSATKGH